MSHPTPPSSTLEQLKREAKRWLKALQTGAADARARLERALPDFRDNATLRDVQHALAREHGFPGWTALKMRMSLESPLERYQRVADAVVLAYRTPDERAIRTVWHYFGHMRAYDAMRRYIRLDLGKTESPQPGEVDEVTLAEAQYLVARAQGFATWDELAAYAGTPGARKEGLATKPLMAFTGPENSRTDEFVSRDWDEVIATIQSRGLTSFGAHGQMTDGLLQRFSQLPSLTRLHIGGSPQVTDAGLKLLANMPQLVHLDISGCRVSADGLSVLRDLPALRTLNAQWMHLDDAALSHLATCHLIEKVDLMGSNSGDGAIRALAGKEHLHHFNSGNGVTDAGLAMLRELPVFREWRVGPEEMHLTGFDAQPNYLLLRGSFTDAGFEAVADLKGLFALNLDNDQLNITGAALTPLRDLEHLAWLGFEATDESMPEIAALPHLRFLMCQDTKASDRGWVSLGASQSIEYIWGRRCYGLERAGFEALGRIPTLTSLSVSCKNVSDEGLASLPSFPSLKELMPMDVPDAGYRHIGKCTQLEALTLMYCRDTGDEATSHITSLPNVKRYFVSYNRITDKTPRLLANIQSLEEITIDSCGGVSDDGIAALAALPRLRKLRVSGMPMVTTAIASAFGPEVEFSHGL